MFSFFVWSAFFHLPLLQCCVVTCYVPCFWTMKSMNEWMNEGGRRGRDKNQATPAPPLPTQTVEITGKRILCSCFVVQTTCIRQKSCIKFLKNTFTLITNRLLLFYKPATVLVNSVTRQYTWLIPLTLTFYSQKKKRLRGSRQPCSRYWSNRHK